MRKLLLIASLLSAPAIASDECAQIHELATAVMKSRQGGVSAPDMYEMASGNKIVEAVIGQAYEKPRYHTDKMKERSIEGFANVWYMGCKQAEAEKL